MSTTHRTVKLDADLIAEADRERKTFSRSLSAQIEHWARIGKAVENAPGMPHNKIRRALNGKITIDDFNDAEMRDYFAQLSSAMQNPNEAEMAFYASLADDAPGISESELYGAVTTRDDGVPAE